MGAGIDYGGLTGSNRDAKTGIHYGVIAMQEVMQAWADSAEVIYIPHCPFCGEELKIRKEYARCPKCRKSLVNEETNGDCPDMELCRDDGYKCTLFGGSSDIFVEKSLYYTYCQFCSPCAPGAGYLMHPLSPDEGIKTYCFSHEWFENNKTPYRVWLVKDNIEVFGGE